MRAAPSNSRTGSWPLLLPSARIHLLYLIFFRLPHKKIGLADFAEKEL
jgi:hypothetical protein